MYIPLNRPVKVIQFQQGIMPAVLSAGRSINFSGLVATCYGKVHALTQRVQGVATRTESGAPEIHYNQHEESMAAHLRRLVGSSSMYMCN